MLRYLYILLLCTISNYSFAQDKLSGTASVTASGAATYSIAIEAPKGVGDLIPSIGLTYNSQVGNGIAGVGYNITGLSVISRGMKDVAHDNTVQGVKYDDSDALYLDGKRLVLMSGTVGTDGAVYSPEGEPLTKITQHGIANCSYFTADTGDGMTYYYGQRLFLNNLPVIAAWFVSTAINPTNRTINYQYTVDNLSCRISEISYGNGNSINFEYENRPDTIFFALGSSRGYISERLKRISTKVNDNVYRTYTFSYSMADASATKLSRLSSISETGENGISSHSMSISWDHLPTYTANCQDAGITVPNDYMVEYNSRNFMSADVNGDGISDIIHFSPVKEYIYNSGGYQSANIATHVNIYHSNISNGNITYGTPYLHSLGGSAIIGDWVLQRYLGSAVDINGDGYNDIFLPYFNNATYSGAYVLDCTYIWGHSTGGHSKSTYRMALSRAQEMPLYILTDINKTGKCNLVVLEKRHTNHLYTLHLVEHDTPSSSYYSRDLTLSSTPRHLFATDMNNDGLADLLVICDDGYRVFYNQGGTQLSGLFTDSSTLKSQVTKHERMECGDFNGDGILDLIWNDNYSKDLWFELGNGDGTFTHQLAYSLPFQTSPRNKDNGTWNCIVGDLDRDGKQDVILNLAYYRPIYVFDKTHTFWLCSDGTKLIEKQHATSNREDDAKGGRVFAGDFTGRGGMDIANYGYNCYGGTNANVDPTMHFYVSSSHNMSKGHVYRLTDSNGRKTDFTYASLSSDLTYTKGSGSQYPIIDVAAAICVTSQIYEYGGSSVENKANYTYGGLRAHLQGRGLLGFRTLNVTEPFAGKVVTTTTSNDDPTYLIPLKSVSVTTQAGYTSTTENIMQKGTFAGAGGRQNYMLFPISQKMTDIYGNETLTTRTYDQTKGLLLTELIEYDEGDLYRQTAYTYSTNKIGGAYRPVSITHTQQHFDDVNPYSSTTTYSYYSNGNPNSTTQLAGSSLALTTTYHYDSYSNVIREIVTGSGISPVMVTEYQYDSANRYLTRKTTEAATISYNRNTFGDLMSETDITNSSRPLATNYQRNGFGTVTQITKPTGEVINFTRSTSSSYNSAYMITTSQAGHPNVRTWYDALDNETRSETTGIGNISINSQTTRNVLGQTITKTSTHGSLALTDHFTYDGLGRLETCTTANGGTISTTYANRTVTTIENGKTFIKTYDAWGNIQTSEDPVSSVSYCYCSNGKPASVTSEGSTVSMQYDVAGNQISLNDPDAGICSYEYDALGRIIRQTDARGKETTYVYDAVGRNTQKTIDGTTTYYNYGTSGNGTGFLTSEQTGITTIAYSYDNKGRMIQESHYMNGMSPLYFGWQYDDNGRVAARTYPNNVTVQNVYDDYGHLVASTIGNRNVSLTTTDNGHSVVRELGGTLTSSSSHATNPVAIYTADYNARGLTQKTLTRNTNVTMHSMTFSLQEGTGNLLQRTGMRSATETFSYDNLDRLTQVSVGGVTQQTLTYSYNGNITNKTGIGSLYYGSATVRPHAVTAVDNTQSSISSATQQVVYNAFGKVQAISDNGWQMDFTYGPDEKRLKTVLKHNGQTVRTTFYANDFEKVTEYGTTRYYYYLDDGVIYVLVGSEQGDEGDFYYAFTDHLGSITRLYDESANLAFRAEYDAWGVQNVTTNTLNFRRGYTGHEMMPEFGLINMNGRLYDPILGRFLSPDNYVQMPDFSQSFNRYSYCINNPLKYNDPSGEFWHLITGALIGGFFNIVLNAPNIDNFWKGLGYFGIGALAGSLSTGVGAGVNVSLAGGSFSAGFMGTAAGISSTGFFAGAISGSAAGALGGFITNAGNSWINGSNFSSGLLSGLNGGLYGGLIGGALGGIISGMDAIDKKVNFWTGVGILDLSNGYGAYGPVIGENTITGKYVGKFEDVNVYEHYFAGELKPGEVSNFRGITIPERGILVGKGVFTKGTKLGMALMQHEYGHILQYRLVGPKAYYSIIAPESLMDAMISTEAEHNVFWTETWANYLSKNYFGPKWLGYKISGYPVSNISTFNRLRIDIAKLLL